MGHVLILVGGLLVAALGVFAFWVPRLEKAWDEAGRPVTAFEEVLLAVSHHAMTWGLLIAALGLGLLVAGAALVVLRGRPRDEAR